MWFTHCATNSAVFVPSRIALASGVRLHRLGTLGDADVYPQEQPTYCQALRDAGYRVGCVGKLDLTSRFSMRDFASAVNRGDRRSRAHVCQR